MSRILKFVVENWKQGSFRDIDPNAEFLEDWSADETEEVMWQISHHWYPGRKNGGIVYWNRDTQQIQFEAESESILVESLQCPYCGYQPPDKADFAEHLSRVHENMFSLDESFDNTHAYGEYMLIGDERTELIPDDVVEMAEMMRGGFAMPLDEYDELDGFPFSPSPAKPVRVEPKVGRNDPCPCGSGRKYKQCCGRSKVH